MWLAVDFTSDRRSKAPLPRETMGAIAMAARREGVLVGRNGSAIELAPPFTIDEDEALDGLAALERVVADLHVEITIA